jgi:hypothetical protein
MRFLDVRKIISLFVVLTVACTSIFELPVSPAAVGDAVQANQSEVSSDFSTTAQAQNSCGDDLFVNVQAVALTTTEAAAVEGIVVGFVGLVTGGPVGAIVGGATGAVSGYFSDTVSVDLNF